MSLATQLYEPNHRPNKQKCRINCMEETVTAVTADSVENGKSVKVQ